MIMILITIRIQPIYAQLFINPTMTTIPHLPKEIWITFEDALSHHEYWNGINDFIKIQREEDRSNGFKRTIPKTYN